MKTELALCTLSCLAVAGCPGNADPTMMPTSDQAPASSSDMNTTTMPDAADPNAPGLLRYSYSCNDQPDKTVELKHEQFGPTYQCKFGRDNFSLNVNDNRVPIDFRLSIPSYHGPGSYMLIADVFRGSGFAYCEWPSMRIVDGNCPVLAPGQISACCLDEPAQANALTCTVTVQQHSLTRVTGTFDCLIHSDRQGPNSPYTCVTPGKAVVHGSFDFGPKDCM